MGDKHYEDVIIAFVNGVVDQFGILPAQLPTEDLKILIASFTHEIERRLKDRYDLDEPDPDEYMHRKINISSPYGMMVRDNEDAD